MTVTNSSKKYFNNSRYVNILIRMHTGGQYIRNELYFIKEYKIPKEILESAVCFTVRPIFLNDSSNMISSK